MYSIILTKKDGSTVSFDRDFSEPIISGAVGRTSIISIAYCNIFTEKPDFLKDVISFDFTGDLEAHEGMVNYTSGSDTIYLDSNSKNRSQLELEASKIKEEIYQLYSLTNIEAPTTLSTEMIMGGDTKTSALVIKDGKHVV